MLGNQKFVIRQKPCLFLLTSFRFTLETSNTISCCYQNVLHENKIINNNIIVIINNKGYNILNN